jgi:hypothetical protein
MFGDFDAAGRATHSKQVISLGFIWKELISNLVRDTSKDYRSFGGPTTSILRVQE